MNIWWKIASYLGEKFVYNILNYEKQELRK